MMNLVVRPNRVAKEFDSFFTDFFNSPAFWSERESDFAPRVNIAEDDNHVVMEFELPGMGKDDIKVAVKDGVLSVSGERQYRDEKKEKNYIRTEMRTGSFCRSFTLPKTIDPDQIKADYKSGILELTLAKREEVKPKEIEIKVS